MTVNQACLFYANVVDMFPLTDSAKNAVDMFPSIDSPKNPVDMFPRTDISK